MTNRVAVMDLGTNTFHLLIAESDPTRFFKEVLHEHVGVKLGEGGINEGTIKADAYQRGIDTLVSFHQFIRQHNVHSIKAIATSAMRSASNGQQFIDEVKQHTGIVIETINGDREAGYIYAGVKASRCLQEANSLIVDIGGGSVEFILGNQREIIYKQSFEIGAARLMAKFHQTDPISVDEVAALNDYLDLQLAPMCDAVKKHNVQSLIGSSGAFETFAELAERHNGHSFDLKQTPTYAFKEGNLLEITRKIIHSNHEERAAMPGILPVRVDMIVVSSLLMQYVMHKLNLHQVVMSAYSLKEGVLAEMFK
ncbi:exopolyphosphatase [Mucilaginibacter sp. PAMB04168]|uniref:Ppx/GppA phosphatase family protein n=1 Tax=Mucilaginibacter sp. PAMB04168 TaxID=3138567 RepID=UPI0031F6694A